MLDFIFKKIQEKLSEFDQKSDKSNDEIRQCKAEIQQLRMELDFEKQKGHFIRDDERLILSAPEIIIGNVDSSGMLYMDTGSTVVVRGSQVDLQGVGQSGQVEVRASGIRQIAEDPWEVVCVSMPIRALRLTPRSRASGRRRCSRRSSMS